MVFIRYPELQNHPKLVRDLKRETVAQYCARTGIPYNSVTNQIKKMSPEMQAQINRGRLSWTEEEKRNILAEGDKEGHSAVARKYDIAPAVLSRWRRELGILQDNPLKRGRPPKIAKKRRAKKTA